MNKEEIRIALEILRNSLGEEHSLYKKCVDIFCMEYQISAKISAYEEAIRYRDNKICDLERENKILKAENKFFREKKSDKKLFMENRMLRGCMINIFKCLIDAGIFKGYNIVFPKVGSTDDFDIFHTKGESV